jgi:hypothetical protein
MGLGDRGVWVRFPVGKIIVSLLRHVQGGSGSHPASLYDGYRERFQRWWRSYRSYERWNHISTWSCVFMTLCLLNKLTWGIHCTFAHPSRFVFKRWARIGQALAVRPQRSIVLILTVTLSLSLSTRCLLIMPLPDMLHITTANDVDKFCY